MGKGQAVASPSPLSPWGQFPLLTGLRLARTGRPPRPCPWRGVRLLPFPDAHIARLTQDTTQTLQVPPRHTPVVRLPDPLLLPTPDASPAPALQGLALSPTGRAGGDTVADGPTDHPAARPDDRGIAGRPAPGAPLALHRAAFLRCATQAEGRAALASPRPGTPGPPVGRGVVSGGSAPPSASATPAVPACRACSAWRVVWHRPTPSSAARTTRSPRAATRQASWGTTRGATRGAPPPPCGVPGRVGRPAPAALTPA